MTYAINEEAARQANLANSLTDYEAGSATAEYNGMVFKAQRIAEAQKRRVDPIHHDKIDALLDKYSKKLADNLNRRNEIAARVPSVLVSGRGNFPTGAKAKQIVALDRNADEFAKIQKILDRIKGVGTAGISSDEQNAVAKLRAKLEQRINLQETMKAANAYYRTHGTVIGCDALTDDQQRRVMQNIEQDLADPYVNSSSVRPFASYQLSNNNAEINRLKKRIAELQAQKEADISGWEFDGGEVVMNKDANRVQILFDEKPDEDLRSELKANGFRWAPSQGAWQRMLNANGIAAARRIEAIRPQT